MDIAVGPAGSSMNRRDAEYVERRRVFSLASALFLRATPRALRLCGKSLASVPATAHSMRFFRQKWLKRRMDIAVGPAGSSINRRVAEYAEGRRVFSLSSSLFLRATPRALRLCGKSLASVPATAVFMSFFRQKWLERRMDIAVGPAGSSMNRRDAEYVERRRVFSLSSSLFLRATPRALRLCG